MAARTPVLRQSASVLLRQARNVLDDATVTTDPGERFCRAQLSALRTAAAALALHGQRPAARRRLVSLWVRLDKAVPEYASWATYFAAAAAVRAAVEAGIEAAVSPGAADEQVRVAGAFLAAVEGSLGMLAA